MAVYGTFWKAWLVYFAHILYAQASITCVDENGQQVDWFIVYKMPKQRELPYPFNKGLGYYYMDANKADWVKGVSSLDQLDNTVARTLQQVYKNPQNLMYVMYNDEHPDGYKSNTLGHTKGVLASDKSSGFWLVHSVPKFPPSAKEAYDYPSTGTDYGQTFLCISLAYKYMDVIGKIYLFNEPSIYNFSLPGNFASDNPNLKNTTEGGRVRTMPYTFTTTVPSLRGEKFQAFAKCRKFNADLYEDLVAKDLKTSLYVESWRNGVSPDINSSCATSYKVYNVKAVEVVDTSFRETRDHSKWAVSTSHPLTCIGDINRQVSQEKRGGGTFCLAVSDVQKNFFKAVTEYEKCPK